MSRRLRHRRTDPACYAFAGYGRTALGRLLFDRGRGKSCPVCFSPERLDDDLLETVLRLLEEERA